MRESVERLQESQPEATVGSESPTRLDASEWVSSGLILFVFLAYGLISGGQFVHRDYFVPLAEALLQGHLDVRGLPDYYNELVPSNGKWYVVFPFMPALLVMPWVLLTKGAANQLWACLFFGAINAALFLDIAKRFGQPLRRALLFAILFAFGTVHWYGASDGGAWHFAQVTALTFLFLAIREVFKEGDLGAWECGWGWRCSAASTRSWASPSFSLTFCTGQGDSPVHHFWEWGRGEIRYAAY